MKEGKNLKIFGICVLGIVFLLFLSIGFMLGGADFTKYPSDKASVWICNNPYVKIDYSKGVETSYLEWDGERIPIFIGMQSSVFDVFRSIPGQEVLKEEDILFRGYWHYEGKKMVVKIYDDRIFDGSYTILVFVPQ
jgi:hypothetical protein